MRTLVLAAALLAAGAAQAQTVSGTAATRGAAGAIPGTTSGATSTGSTALGRLPAPLGSTSTLGERIDRAAGLGTSRARGGTSLPATLRPEGRNGTSIGGSLFSAPSAIDTAGRPAGTPLGTTAALPR